MKKPLYLILFLFLGTFYIKAQSSIKELHFLEGYWKVENKETYEKWSANDNSSLSGESFKIVNGIKEVTEYLSIKPNKDHVIYTATVLNQNKGKGVDFTLYKINESKYSFENLSHDFPKKIIYKKIDSMKIFVEVLGEEGKGFSYNIIKSEEPRIIPDWFLDYLESNIGTWITDNRKNVSEKDPYIEFGIDWKWGIGKTSIIARLYGILEGGEEVNFWEFRQYWDNVKAEGVIAQYGNWGMTGIGDVKQLKNGTFETIQTFSLTDGKTWIQKHVIEIEDKQFTSTSYDKDEKKNWVNPKGWTWVKSTSEEFSDTPRK